MSTPTSHAARFARRSFIRSIGSGAYGVVISAQDARDSSKVAVKKIPNAFQDEIDAKRILREIKVRSGGVQL